MKQQEGLIVLFDGVCNLCTGVVKFSVKQDKKGKLRYASLQSEVAKTIMRKHNLDENQLKTFVFVDNDKIYTRSTAGLKLLSSFGGLWTLVYAFIIVPRPIRDAVYDFISRNRYRWFGKEESCMIPSPEIRARFLG